MAEKPTKLPADIQLTADAIMQKLPEDIAFGVSFKLHEGGDGLELFYPINLNGTPEFKEIDNIARSYGGTWVNRRKGEYFFLIPRQRPKPAAATVSSKISDNTSLKPEAQKPAPNDAKPPQPEKKESPTQQQLTPTKQPSPLTLFERNYCAVCEDWGER